MRTRLLGFGALAWGLLILIHPFGTTPAHASAAYRAGGHAALAFGGVLLVGGIVTIARGLARR